jgi:hypothetical protein
MEWGFLTEPEQSHRARQSERARRESHEPGAVLPAEELDKHGEEPA